MNTNFGAGRGAGKHQKSRVRWHDYGARFYEPAIGRWHTVDPSCEDGGQESVTTYGYVFNDPIKHNDPDGRFPLSLKSKNKYPFGNKDLTITTGVTIEIKKKNQLHRKRELCNYFYKSNVRRKVKSFVLYRNDIKKNISVFPPCLS